MARFVVNEPVVTSQPEVVVDAGLPVGRHLFQLVVEDSSGNQSEPDVVQVRITQTLPPIG
jgi:hypothetical protein